jgi:hypothetical protein
MMDENSLGEALKCGCRGNDIGRKGYGYEVIQRCGRFHPVCGEEKPSGVDKE